MPRKNDGRAIAVIEGIATANVFSIPKRVLEARDKKVITPKKVPKTNEEIVSGLFNTLLMWFTLADPT